MSQHAASFHFFFLFVLLISPHRQPRGALLKKNIDLDHRSSSFLLGVPPPNSLGLLVISPSLPSDLFLLWPQNWDKGVLVAPESAWRESQWERGRAAGGWASRPHLVPVVGAAGQKPPQGTLLHAPHPLNPALGKEGFLVSAPL